MFPFIKLAFVKFDWLISYASFHLLIIITCFNQSHIKTEYINNLFIVYGDVTHVPPIAAG